jgi:hypothetical protein
VQEPQALSDKLGQPNSNVPVALRDDPTGHVFAGPPSTTSEVLLGAARLHLAYVGTPAAPFQVVATLYLESNGFSRLLSRAAGAVLEQDGVNGTLELRFDWTKADLQPGDRIVVKVDANDETAFLPLPANYAVAFGGASSIELPYFEG